VAVKLYYQAIARSPIFAELKQYPLRRTSGIRDVLHEGLATLADRIEASVCVADSIARGEETASSDVDLMVVGEVSFADVVSALGQIESKCRPGGQSHRVRPREFEKSSRQESFSFNR